MPDHSWLPRSNPLRSGAVAFSLALVVAACASDERATDGVAPSSADQMASESTAALPSDGETSSGPSASTGDRTVDGDEPGSVDDSASEPNGSAAEDVEPATGDADPGGTGPAEITIDANGFTFDATSAGPDDGQVVILLHGFPQNRTEWRFQIPELAAAGYRVIAPDQRGYSPGAQPEGVDNYATELLADDVVAMADALGVDRFHLVGHDWGGGVAWLVALLHPERLLSLTSASTPHPDALTRALADPDSGQSEQSGYVEVFIAEGSEDRFLANDGAFLRAALSGTPATDEELDEIVAFFSAGDTMRHALDWYRAGFLFEEVTEAGPVSVPTLYAWSSEDRALGRAAAEMTGEFVSGPYRFEIIEGVDHWLPENGADEFTEMLLEHLAANGGADTPSAS